MKTPKNNIYYNIYIICNLCELFLFLLLVFELCKSVDKNTTVNYLTRIF